MARRVGSSQAEMGRPSKQVVVLAVVGAIIIIMIRNYQQSDRQNPLYFFSA